MGWTHLLDMLSVHDVNQLSKEAFVATFADVFEHSPHFAETAFATLEANPFKTFDDIHAAFCQAVELASPEAQDALIREHPDLAGKLAVSGSLTQASTEEQASAGLDRLSEHEFADISQMNERYKARFGFPFIICVKDYPKAGIFAAFRNRLEHAQDAERATAVAQIKRIAYHRLKQIVA